MLRPTWCSRRRAPCTVIVVPSVEPSTVTARLVGAVAQGEPAAEGSVVDDGPVARGLPPATGDPHGLSVVEPVVG